MKTSTLTSLIRGATLGVALLAGSITWALPPTQHAIRGTIENIDRTAHTLTLLPANGGQPLAFAWKASTRFVQGSSRICSGALEAGQPVSFYYRREYGQLIPRKVSLRTDTPTRCTAGECCKNGDEWR